MEPKWSFLDMFNFCMAGLLVILIIVWFFLICGKSIASVYESDSPDAMHHYSIRPKPVCETRSMDVQAERYDVALLMNDPQVLQAISSSKPKPVEVKYVTRTVYKEQRPARTISASYEEE